jgi:hypothetical protein
MPIGVIARAGVLLAITILVTVVYDLHWWNTNEYVAAAARRIEEFQPRLDRPLVVLIGSSVEMLATPMYWENDEFDWLRLIIQGSTIDEFRAVADELVRLDPDLVVIGMGSLIANPRVDRLRAAFKRMLRAPLEELGVIRATFRHDNRSCGNGVYSPEEALERSNVYFQDGRNQLASSDVIEHLLEGNIPFATMRTNMVDAIEESSIPRKSWLMSFREEARERSIPILENDLVLDESYFCADHFHMNDRGQRVFTEWLKVTLLERPELSG